MISLKDLDRENWIRCARLSLDESQKDYVAPNVYSIAESKVEEHYCPRVICFNDEVVGFLMYCVEIDPPDETLFWLFRFMIDKNSQAKGYGTKVLQIAIDEMAAKGAKRIRTMYKSSNYVTGKLYKKMGFRETGEYDECGDIILELNISN
ncbi:MULTISPECIES: GNAT family N-acetyltransferase [Acinetobacter calcoaceticus/baumannii complex]|uniref:N-acetyltransferase n=2 Tax=Acinetobacter pittii TaxID=48296 RepID=A0A6S4UKB7_ACIPI|nr:MULTISPECIES: GNAT family N-acetyltransferase [Acinetobacter calcoaceticus/baumannii complex]KQG46849.1 histone acetyltransferase [Acinetobacter pittii]MCH2051644.1 GNAT family N-acetyltransferase [Acinetobacter pittii]MDX8184848.1 GNAT family N-acetyltransferase [Acinetobacter pittii]MDX8275512.1 GNAT family N-acetyltransferase [Acinetobacter pittii]OCY26266.1 histone acetyltransferase [Acinetobacter pittii]